MLFQKYAFSLSSKKHRSIRVHTTVLMRFRIKRSKTIELIFIDLYCANINLEKEIFIAHAQINCMRMPQRGLQTPVPVIFKSSFSF